MSRPRSGVDQAARADDVGTGLPLDYVDAGHRRTVVGTGTAQALAGDHSASSSARSSQGHGPARFGQYLRTSANQWANVHIGLSDADRAAARR